MNKGNGIAVSAIQIVGSVMTKHALNEMEVASVIVKSEYVWKVSTETAPATGAVSQPGSLREEPG